MGPKPLVLACVLSAWLAVPFPSALHGQDRSDVGIDDPASASGAPRGARRLTALAGAGNALGWFGGQVERYLGGDRYSVFGGAGYTPSLESGDPSGPTFAAGGRAYTSGRTHRAFLEISISQVMTVTRARMISSNGGGSTLIDGDRLYGPGLQLGYQFVSGGGFTALISAGVGYGVDSEVGDVGSMGGLAFGYTWR